MAKLCFCGCGRKVPFGRGAQNTSGRRVLMAYEDLKATRPAMKMAGDSSDFETFMLAGERLVAELRSVVHGEMHSRQVDQRDMRHWLRTAWKALPSARLAAAAAANHAAEQADEELTTPEKPDGRFVPPASQSATQEEQWYEDDDLDEIAEEVTVSADDEEGRFARYLRRTGGGDWERHADLVNRVESMLRKTRVPWTREPVPEIFWTLSADVGDVWAFLSKEGNFLTLYQSIHELQPDQDESDYLTALLAQNFTSAGGACFAVRADDDGSRHVVVVCRLPAPTLDQEELETAMENLFFLSSLFDEPT